MADIPDNLGRVGNFDSADLDSIAEALKSAVGKAVEYAAGKAKTTSEDMGKRFDELASALEELGDDIRESLESTSKFVDEVKKAAESMGKRPSSGDSGRDSFAAAQREQTRVLNMILKNQQRAMAEKTARFTSGGSVLSAAAPRRPALKEMGFRPRGADKIPAMLSPGEFVVSRRGTRGNEGVLDRINRGYMSGGKVKPAYLASGTGGTSGSGSISVSVSPDTPPEMRDRIREQFERAGIDASIAFDSKYRQGLESRMAEWFTGIGAQFTGREDPFAVLFSGSVTDITDYRKQMRQLAFQVEGITGQFRDAQAEFARTGSNIAAETGKNLSAFNKSYVKNLKKGFAEQKAGMKVIKSGLLLSTMIGSETEQTADTFADWHRSLGLSAIEMEKMATDMRGVALSTGVTGDELLGAMKSSEGILKNLRNQGNLTSNVTKSVVTMMAEAKKTGYEESTSKFLTALSSHSGMKSADTPTQALLYSVGNMMGGTASRDMLTGNFMKKRENLAGFSTNMKELVGSMIGKSGAELDFKKLTDDERDLLAMRLQAYGIEIGEAESLIKTTEKASKGLRGTMEEIDEASKNRFATDEEKRLNEKKRNDVLLSASMDFLSGVRNKTGDQSLADAMKQLEGSKEFSDQRADFAAMASAVTPAMARQFGLGGSKEQMSQQMAAMDMQKQTQLSALIAADQLMKAAQQQGKSVKNFGPEMQAALAGGDTKRFNELRDAMQAEASKIGVDQATGVDPTIQLDQTMNKLNETIRGFMSPFVGGVLDLIGHMGLLAIQFGIMAAALYNTIGGNFIGKIMDGGLGTWFMGMSSKVDGVADSIVKSDKVKDGVFKRFFKTYSDSRKGSSGLGWKKEGKGIFSSFGDSFKGLGDDIFKGFSKARGSTARFFSKFSSGFKFGWKSSGNFFTAMTKGFGRAMKSSEATRGILTRMGGALKSVNGRYVEALASLRKVSPALSNFLRRSVNLGKSFATLKLGQIVPRFASVMKSGLKIFGSGFSSIKSVFSGGFSGVFKGAKGLIRGGFSGMRAALLGGTLGTAQIIFSAIDMVFGAVSGFRNTGKNFEGVMKAMGKSTDKMTWGMYASSTVAGALVGILDGLTFGLLSMTGATKWLNETLSLVLYTVFSVVEGIIDGIMVPFQMLWSAVKYIGVQFKSIGDSILGVFNSIAGIFGSQAGNWSEAFAMLYPWLKRIGMVIGIIVGTPLMATLWLLAKGISLALVPIQMMINAIAGVIKVIAGFVKFFTDIFKVGLWQATKNLAWTVLEAVYGVFKPVVDFIGSLVNDIMAPFKWLYNILVGHSIIPDLCVGIVGFFGKMAAKVLKYMAALPLKAVKFVASLPGRVVKGLNNVFFKAPAKVFGKIMKHLGGKTVKEGIVAVSGRMSGFFGLFGKNLTELTGFFSANWFNFLNKASGGIFGKIVDGVKNSKIISIIDDYLIKPISGAISWLGNKAGEVFSWLGGKIKDVFQGAAGWIRGQASRWFPGLGGGASAGPAATSAADDVARSAAAAAGKGASAATGAADDVAKAAATAAGKGGARTVSAAASSVDDLAKTAPTALSFLGKSSGLIKGMAKKLPVVGPLLDFGIRKVSGESTGKAIAGAGAGAAGGLGGAALGATIGTLIFPGVGTAIGGLIGGVMGGVGAGMASDAIYDNVVGTGGGAVNAAASKAADKMGAKSAAVATPVGTHAVPALKTDEEVKGVEPVHLRDITGTILRDRAGSSGNKIQSDELSRMEEASYKQVSELEQIKQGIQELVSLMKPRGSSVASRSDEMNPASTKDPRRPMHAAQFGKMKYGKMGGSPNRSFVNNGEV